jgi:acyl-coenzyme A synthetase/AMP-(fatty) acid ligase
VLHSHLWAGGSVVVDRRSMFPNRLIGSTIDHACTSFAGVPFTYEQLKAAADFDRLAGSSLKRFLQAGGKLDVQVVESIVARVPSADFYVMYGQTEATSRISTFEVHRHTAKLGSAGMPLDNLKVFPVGADFRPLAAGRSGELAVCGPSVAAGFWNDVDGTAERFVNGTLLTGDVGHVDDDGFIWIEGRIADFLKMRGMRVSIGEIEARLRLAEGISEIAAFPAYHPRHGEAFGLAVVAEKEHDRAGIVRDLTRRIDPLWICAGINFVDSLPRNDAGKILRGRLAEKCDS